MLPSPHSKIAIKDGVFNGYVSTVMLTKHLKKSGGKTLFNRIMESENYAIIPLDNRVTCKIKLPLQRQFYHNLHEGFSCLLFPLSLQVRSLEDMPGLQEHF